MTSRWSPRGGADGAAARLRGTSERRVWGWTYACPLTHTRRDAAAVAVDAPTLLVGPAAVTAATDWLRTAARRRAAAGDRQVGDRGPRDPGHRADGARGCRPDRAGGAACARRAAWRWSAASGNNGGDGLVVARLLRERGRDVDVLLLADPGELRGDALANYERLPAPGARAFEPAALEGAAAIVDAILGTGFAGEPREPGSLGDRGDQPGRRADRRRGLRRAQRGRRLDRRGGRRGRARRRHRDLPRRQARALDRPRQDARRAR